MIYITKVSKGFMVVTTGENGEPLATSETLTKANAKNNIAAQLEQFEGWSCLFQDDTLKVPKRFIAYTRGRIIKSYSKPQARYKLKK